MIIKVLVCILCIVLPVFAMELGFGFAGNIGIGFSKWEIDVRDPQAQLLADHLSSSELTFGLGPTFSFWFNKNFGLNMGVQYSWYDYNYTYDYATTAEAIEWKWSYNNLIFPVNLKIGLPLGKNRAFIGAGFLIFKQLNGKMSGLFWGDDWETENVPDEYLETNILPRFLIGAEFYTGDVGYQTCINYHYGLDGVDERFEGSPNTTHHVIVSFGVLYYVGRS